MESENNTEGTVANEPKRPEVPSFVTDALQSQFWCDFHNACRRRKEKKVKKLFESVLGSVGDTYVADVEIGAPIHNPQNVTFNLFSFHNDLPTELFELCKWLSDDSIQVHFSWFAYAASDEDE